MEVRPSDVRDAWSLRELCGALRAELEVRFQEAADPPADVVAHGGSRLVEHVRILGLPHLRGSAHASIAGGLVHVAAVVGARLAEPGSEFAGAEEQGLVHGGIEAEMYRCCQLIELVLRGCRATWADLVRLTAFVPGLTDAKVEALEGAAELFARERGCPAAVARTVVGCSRLRMEAAVQLEAVAVAAPPREPSSASSPSVPPRASPSVHTSPSPGPPPGLEQVNTLTAHAPVERWSIMSDESGALPRCSNPRSSSSTTPCAGFDRKAWSQALAAGPFASLGFATATQEEAPAATAAAAAAAHRATLLNPGAPRFVPAAPAPAAGEPAPLVGTKKDLLMSKLPSEKVQQLRAELQEQHTHFWQVQMVAKDAYRTVRLDPSELLCRRAPLLEAERNWAHRKQNPSHSVWSFSFDVAMTRTVNSFINVGLVEWLATAKGDAALPGSPPSSQTPPPAAAAAARLGGDVGEGEHAAATASAGRPLSQVTGACGEEEERAAASSVAWQHVHENPRQMMLGFRKGVKWYGDAGQEPLFKDDLCEGTLLRFRCDQTLSPDGEIVQLTLWLLPSRIVFRNGGQQCVRIAKPLFEFPSPWFAAEVPGRKRSLWVPAVTLYSKDDSVLIAWCGNESRQ